MNPLKDQKGKNTTYCRISFFHITIFNIKQVSFKLWSRFKYSFLNFNLYVPLKDNFLTKVKLKKQLWYLFFEKELTHFKTIRSLLRDRLHLNLKSPRIPHSSSTETGKMQSQPGSS